jgi:sigma-B regulation protein RsbU (phosphoserine phosphatase)
MTNQASILVIDDVEANRDLLIRRLSRYGYSVMTAENGKDAIALLHHHLFDLILCDVTMPEMDGYQFLAFTKADETLRHIPVIMVSAVTETESVVRCIELGAEDYLLKPFNPTILKARVGACLQKKWFHDQEQAYLQQIEAQTHQLAEANAKILSLNECLQAENLRLSAELEVTRSLQRLILPREHELEAISDLEITAFMEPASEVGGDYYDVFCQGDRLIVGIGDVTGHGLESGMVMLMAQTAVRTLVASGETDLVHVLSAVNQLIYDNTRRMQSPRNMTLALLEYNLGTLKLIGQHEEVICVRHNGTIERFDTIDLGFPLGLERDISTYVAEKQINLESGDLAVLYTDGIPEAMNADREQYSLERLHQILSLHCNSSVKAIQQAIINDVKKHIGAQKVYDDITLLILKQR